MAPRATQGPPLEPLGPTRWCAGRGTPALYSGTRAGAPQRRGGRRAGARQDPLWSWSCSGGPWPRLGEQPQPHRPVAFSTPPALQLPLPTAGEAPLSVAFGLSSVRRCRRPPLPGTPRPPLSESATVCDCSSHTPDRDARPLLGTHSRCQATQSQDPCLVSWDQKRTMRA